MLKQVVAGTKNHHIGAKSALHYDSQGLQLEQLKVARGNGSRAVQELLRFNREQNTF